MIDKIDRELKTWVSNVGSIDKSQVGLAPPGEDQQTVSLYLMQVVRVMTAHENLPNAPAPSKIILHYLVTVQHDDMLQAHQLLGDLMFAAMEDTEFEVDLDPFPISAWVAFNQVPRPCFVLKVPLRHERPERIPKRVTKPMALESVATTSLHGIVLGPDDIPLHGALVELPDLQLVQRTDRNGVFLFATIPGGTQQRRLRIRAKGKLIEQSFSQPGTAADPLVVRVEFES